jgi:competence protein ComEC
MRPKLIFLTLVLPISLLFYGHTGPLRPTSSGEDQPKMIAYMIDVGMGDAIFIDIPPKDCMLVDAGSWDNYGIDNLMNFLGQFFSDPDHASYQNTLDVVIATHQHMDHIQGMLNVLKKYKVTTYIDNGVGCKIAQNKATDLVNQVEQLIRTKSIRHAQITEKLIETKGQNGVYTDTLLDPFRQVDIFALAATPNTPDPDENDNSIVLKVTCGNVSFLLTGDAESKEEQRLIARLKASGNLSVLDVDVLKAGHHGSNTASTEEFVMAASPKISLISVGLASESPKTRGFRLPKESVLKRLAMLTSNDLKERWSAQVFPDKKPKGAKSEKPKSFRSTKEIYLTSSDGTVVLRTDGIKLEAEPFEFTHE